MERAAVILLDTHVLIWLAGEPRRLSKPAARAIRSALASGGNVPLVTSDERILACSLIRIVW